MSLTFLVLSALGAYAPEAHFYTEQLEPHPGILRKVDLGVNTDIFEHGLDAMFLLESDPRQRFENLREPWSFLDASRFEARSRRELQCEREGTRVWRLAYRRQPR